MFWKNDTHGCGKSTANYRNPEDITVLKLFTKTLHLQWNRQIPKHTSKSQARKKSWDVICIFCLVWSQVPKKVLLKILTSFNHDEPLLILKLYSFSCNIRRNWLSKQKPPKSFQCPPLFRATLPHWARKMLQWRHFAKIRSPNGAKPCQNPPSASATKEVKGRQLVPPSIRKAKLLLLRSHLNCKPKFTNYKTRGERAGLVKGTWYVPLLQWTLAFPPGEKPH